MAPGAGWDALPELARRVARVCFVKGMRQYAAESRGWASIVAWLNETDEGQLRQAVGSLVEHHILRGDDTGYFFTKDGAEWAVAQQKLAAASPLGGLSEPNPTGPKRSEFPWPVDNPSDRRWVIGQLFDTGRLRKDKGLRDEVIGHMEEVLADPNGYGKQRLAPESPSSVQAHPQQAVPPGVVPRSWRRAHGLRAVRPQGRCELRMSGWSASARHPHPYEGRAAGTLPSMELRGVTHVYDVRRLDS
jgi:hypothetical protein